MKKKNRIGSFLALESLQFHLPEIWACFPLISNLCSRYLFPLRRAHTPFPWMIYFSSPNTYQRLSRACRYSFQNSCVKNHRFLPSFFPQNTNPCSHCIQMLKLISSWTSAILLSRLSSLSYLNSFLLGQALDKRDRTDSWAAPVVHWLSGTLGLGGS